MILGANGQNIYPEEIEARLNNMPYVAESLIIRRKNKLVGLVFPDFHDMEEAGINLEELEKIMNASILFLESNSENSFTVNKLVA